MGEIIWMSGILVEEVKNDRVNFLFVIILSPLMEQKIARKINQFF